MGEISALASRGEDFSLLASAEVFRVAGVKAGSL